MDFFTKSTGIYNMKYFGILAVRRKPGVVAQPGSLAESTLWAKRLHIEYKTYTMLYGAGHRPLPGQNHEKK